MKAPIPIPDHGVRIIARPEEFTAPRPDMRVVGVFNPGATEVWEGDLEKTLIMYRVAVAPKEPLRPRNRISFPRARTNQEEEDKGFGIEIERKDIKRDIVPRTIAKKDAVVKQLLEGGIENVYRLRHISYPIMARSLDGVVFSEREKKPSFYPKTSYEKYGIEDPRIVHLNGLYILSYTCPDINEGVSGSFATTKDFETFTRLPHSMGKDKICTSRPLFPGEKNNVPLPGKAENPYVLNALGEPARAYAKITRIDSFRRNSPAAIYLSFSPDFLHWGVHHKIMQARNPDDSIAPATNLVRGEIKGMDVFWGFYHEVRRGVYSAGLFALDANEPWKLISRTPTFMKPGEHDEGSGYVPNVVYPTGLIVRDGVAFTYAGEEDTWTSVRDFPEESCISYMESFT